VPIQKRSHTYANAADSATRIDGVSVQGDTLVGELAYLLSMSACIADVYYILP
jgi:hypothetical protein